jgi:hypothetical protein
LTQRRCICYLGGNFNAATVLPSKKQYLFKQKIMSSIIELCANSNCFLSVDSPDAGGGTRFTEQ